MKTVAVACVVLVGCSGSSGSLPAGGDGGTTTVVDAGSCTSIPGSALPSGASAASGTFSGAASGTVCSGGASARIEAAGSSQDTAPFLFELSTTVGPNRWGDHFLFSAPAGASDGELNVMVGLTSVATGVLTETSAGTCGSGAFTYYLPVPAGLDCDAGVAPNCPNGCSSECSGFGCEPCTPQPPSVSYTAKAAGDCLGTQQTPSGSWTLTLTSVTPSTAGTSATTYTPHGTFTTSLAGADGAPGTVTLSITF